jgi:hypothetical protein
MKKLCLLLASLVVAAPAHADPAPQASETPRVDACPTDIPSVRWGGFVMIPCSAMEHRGLGSGQA